MGARLDATNIIPKPEVCAITSIGFDHTEVLGSTLELIAAEKSAVIKEGGAICITGPTVIQESVMARVFQVKANLIHVQEPNFRLANRDMV